MKNQNRCSQCPESVTIDNKAYCEFVETLERLFPETPHPLNEAVGGASEDINKTISVVMLGGECTALEYRSDMTVYALKNLVKERLGPPQEKQRLLYKERELKVTLSGLHPFIQLKILKYRSLPKIQDEHDLINCKAHTQKKKKKTTKHSDSMKTINHLHTGSILSLYLNLSKSGTRLSHEITGFSYISDLHCRLQTSYTTRLFRPAFQYHTSHCSALCHPGFA